MQPAGPGGRARKAPAQLTDIVGDITESGARGKSKGALTGAVEADLRIAFKEAREDDEREPEPQERSARVQRAASRRRRSREE